MISSTIKYENAYTLFRKGIYGFRISLLVKGYTDCLYSLLIKGYIRLYLNEMSRILLEVSGYCEEVYLQF